MAKKNKNQQAPPPQQGTSKPESFTHGMISDLDPHFQLEGSYYDAKNIRLTNSTGDTFTVENIEGNSLFVDLGNYDIYTIADQGQTNPYPTFFDRGPNTTLQFNLELDNRASIVGHVSYASQLLLMIVARFDYDIGYADNPSGGWTATPFYSPKDRTIFLMVDFDHEFRVQKVTDLRVCYRNGGDDAQYPDLNMDLDNPVSIEHIVENESISRIYWTDNKNQLRTLNIKQSRLDLLSINSLDITPLMNPSQPVLATTLNGSLPVGVYQYCYKYISENGGESTFSPLSNIYHVSDQSFGSSTLYGGGPKGNLGTQGFQIDVNDVDENFEYIELYALLYEEQNNPPRVCIVSRNTLSGTKSTFQHVVWNNEVENGLEEILIESNTFDVCKDIAIKDNILFAANLRQKRNFISEKEWNVKVLRWRRASGISSQELDAMLTTNDLEVKHYHKHDYTSEALTEVHNGMQDYNNHYCGHGQLLGGPDNPAGERSAYASTANGGTATYLDYDGNLNNPMWTTCVASQRGRDSGGLLDARVKNSFEYRYLSDRMTLGGESFQYAANDLGGCRVSFGVEEKTADQSQNPWSSPFISSSSKGGESATEFVANSTTLPYTNPIGNTKFKASMNLGGSKDPHLAGNKKGYQRGDVYRFGVQTYDLNGSPGNVLWIGDIETPQQHDILRMIDFRNQSTTVPDHYTPSRPTIEVSAWNTYTGNSAGGSVLSWQQFISHEHLKDHRLSFIYGHTVPPVDVEWFSARLTNSIPSIEAYVKPNGKQIHSEVRPGTTSNRAIDGRVKALPAWQNWQVPGADPYGQDLDSFDGTHYLYDMYVFFEFRIPSDVAAKISGFRIVRAERQEEDRRIVQQGLLNQTAQYGQAKYGQKYGYDTTRFCTEDNKGFDEDPVFVNQWNDQSDSGAAEPTLPEQPEYNVYLNGYLGLAENSHLAFYHGTAGDFTSGGFDGKVTSGGNTSGKVFYWPEREDTKTWLGGGAEQARGEGANSSTHGGPGTFGKHYRHSAYFGSFDKFNNQTGNGDPNLTSQTSEHISGSIFTLDSPDSAFGIRPYVYREGDMLRIDSSLKLSDETRFKPATLGTNTTFPHYAFENNRGISKKQFDLGSFYGFPWDDNSVNGYVERWVPEATDHTLREALSFCTRKEIDSNYDALIGKYYCYDPYFGIGMEIDGGESMGANWHEPGDGAPDRQYGWQLPIATSKEITDGEIIPNGFFKISKRVKYGKVNGFSNNTLGYVKRGQISNSTDSASPNYNLAVFKEAGASFVFGAVNSSLAHIQTPAGGSSNQQSEVKKEDYTYDTVSTVQMGLRSIIIEVDNRYGEVRKYSALSSYWGDSNQYPDKRYHAWFAPLNLSALYTHSNWYSEDHNGSSPTTTAGGYNSQYNYAYLSSWKSHRMAIANATDGSEAHDNSVNQTFNQRGKDLVPFKYLCSIVRNVTPYGGHTKGAIEKTRYIPCGNFHPVNTDLTGIQNHASQVFGGDTFVNLYSHQKTSTPYMKKSAARWQVFPVESYVNTDMRSGLTLNSSDTVIGKEMNQPPFSNDWLYNSVYSQANNIKSSLSVDEEKFDESLNLPYEIAYSNTKILGQKSDAFRVFPINQFHDMEGLYGEINRIINFKNEIYILQDSAFAKLLVNPLSMLSDDAGTSLFTGTGETVENHIYISTKYGSRHRFSVAMSEKSLYFVDSNFGRLFKYDTEKLISLGDALGQRNYLRYVIKEWEQRSYKICQADSGNGGAAGGIHSGGPVLHGTNYGLLDSSVKPDDNRNYLSDNPLSFLGITSIYDYKHKELLVTFHNSSWENKNHKRQQFSRIEDNHLMGSTTHGEPVGHSETLVYSEAINAFTSKYNVAPPQWLAGGQGSFILCPENEINVVSIANFNRTDGLHYPGVDGSHGSNYPYNLVGSTSKWARNRRCNPLRLWVWDKHTEKHKTNFFGRKDDWIKLQAPITSPIDATASTTSGQTVKFEGTINVAEESYIVKIINSEAANSKVFDNSKIVMTPDHVDFSFIDYTTDITHDTVNIKSVLDPNKTTVFDETEQLVINRRWDFNGTMHGWHFYDGSTYPDPSTNIIIDPSFITLEYTSDGRFRSPDRKNLMNIPGKYNNIIRMRVRRTLDGGNWEGRVYFTGFDPKRKASGDILIVYEADSRSLTIPEPPGIDDGFVIIEWDMSGVGGDNTNPTPSAEWQHSGGAGVTDGAFWDDCIIQQIRIDLSGDTGSSTFDVDWVEIGGLKGDKYIDGVLKTPLRTEKSTRRTRGTWAKIKYSAQTTDKFNIFAILAKYRKTY